MNWLEKGCVRAAPAFKRRTSQHDLMGGMLRQGHLSHRSASKLFEAPKSTVLEPLRTTEVSSTDALESFALQASHYRFRPSILLPFAACASASFGSFQMMTCFGDTYIGHILGAVSPTLSTSYAAGVKLAIGDYYNDQIREIYAALPEAPEAVPLKEAAKQDAVAQYAKTITQVLLRPGSEV
ncbi:hypothetical protein DYB30_001039 [Aphanomyces astaci]|uniref:Uncharacterized protein n=1 Tax=Aphanomyces astaci TaxID=112090 RepID=A0A397FX20_APHAT|nr:hypothetical protein DYB34_000225 [Aphanomyces astaci]RHY68465.1 hypothetical protein DYB30_001039 [Aphanomyces astaci]RHZ40755.1 hypothetical protein DYB31_003099 [Aphanomyces astaci]